MELVDTCTNTTSRILVVQYLTIFFFFPFSKKKKQEKLHFFCKLKREIVKLPRSRKWIHHQDLKKKIIGQEEEDKI